MSTKLVDEIEAPLGLNVAEARDLLRETASEPDFKKRIDLISARFIGSRYAENTLIGGPETPEALAISLDLFDCVTYIETVLALAAAGTVEEFITTVRHLRYEKGEVNWRRRNHFMIDWVRNNEAQGRLLDLTTGPLTIEKTRVLNAVAGLPEKRATFSCFPKRRLSQVSSLCETGDLILFASTKKWLDVFHVGLLAKTDGGLLMRHATRTAGRVVEQELTDFMKKNRMSGLMLARPLD